VKVVSSGQKAKRCQSGNVNTQHHSKGLLVKMSVVIVTVISVSVSVPFQPGPQALTIPMKPKMATTAEKDFMLTTNECSASGEFG